MSFFLPSIPNLLQNLQIMLGPKDKTGNSFIMEFKVLEDMEESTIEETIENAKSFYANGASISLIANSLNMTEEQVKEIVKGVTVTV